MLECKKTVFTNGLRLLVTPMPYSTVTSISGFLKSGSRSEPRDESGLLHLIEHLVFKGGRRFPTGYALSFAAECAGAEHDAQTTTEYVFFYLTYNASHGLFGLEILEDMILNAKFSPRELGIERQNVINEMARFLESDQDVLAQRALQHLFFRGHPLDQEITGTKNTLYSFTRKDVLRLWGKTCVAKNLVLSVAGPVEVSHVQEEVGRRFGGMPSGDEILWKPFDYSAIPRERIFLLSHLEKEQADVLLAFPTPGYLHEDLDSIEMLSTILGKGVCSRLFQSVRETRGLSYDVGANHVPMEGVGIIGGLWGTEHKSLYRSIVVAAGEIKNLRRKLPTDDDMRRAKGFLMGLTALKYNSAESVARIYGRQELLLGGPISLSELTRRLDRVTKEDVLRAARTYLKKESAKIGVSALKKFCDEERILEALDRAL